MQRYYWERYSDKNSLLGDKRNGNEGSKSWLLDIIPDNESILDIGCGPGIVFDVFKKAGRNNPYLGVDIDPNYLKLAKTFYPEIEVEHQDANFLHYRDGSYDNCILFTVIESLPDFRKAVDEAVRVASKRVIITICKEIYLIEEKDYNAVAVSYPPEYMVRINRNKFINYLNSFNLNINSGELRLDNEVQYWWWVISKI